MTFTTAFVQPALNSSFLGKSDTSRTCSVRRAPMSPASFRMMADDDKKDKKPRISFPFGKGKKLPVVSGKKKEDADPEAAEGFNETKTRGLNLLVEDFKKNLPEAAGVGRQDATGFMKPQFGEPGYKPQAYETVKVSKLGISPFSEDKNYVSKVGGIDAVKKAAKDVVAGAKAEDIKKAVMKAEKVNIEPKKEKVYDIPDYLKPLPEDTPRRGMSWVNIIPKV